jgi:hypothetical protein
VDAKRTVQGRDWDILNEVGHGGGCRPCEADVANTKRTQKGKKKKKKVPDMDEQGTREGMERNGEKRTMSAWMKKEVRKGTRDSLFFSPGASVGYRPIGTSAA